MGTPSPNRPSDDQLRRLYVEQRLSAEKIAEQCSVQKITVLRWLEAAGIERRPALGLANRGLVPPAADELRHLVEVEHLPYRTIGERYKISATGIAVLVKKYGIRQPSIWETRRPGGFPAVPSTQELRARASAGESLSAIAKTTGAPITHVRQAFVAHGIPINHTGWGRDLTCADGHHARSVYELRVDDWLGLHSLAHDVEPSYPWDRRYRADFLVGSTYVEVWGVEGDERYNSRKRRKIDECRRLGLPLIQINWWNFGRQTTWIKRLRPLLQVERLNDSLLDVTGEDALG